MKHSLPWLTLAIVFFAAPMAHAEEWVKVAENSVGDRFFVDKLTIQRTKTAARYWEYREFQQPNNAFLPETVDQPVFGVVLNWSADCQNNTQRLRQITAYNKERKVIRKFSYGDAGTLAKAQEGSSANKSLRYACAAK
jgi:hypothetical protein